LTGGPRRRRRVPYLLLGVVLVVGCAVAGLVADARVGSREPVLVLARPVTVGHVLAAEDVREVRISADGVDTLGAGDRDSVLGKPVAYSLPAGTVLSRAAVGAAQVPPPGEAIAAVALKAGQFPTGLSPGSRVTVVVPRDQRGVDHVGGRSPVVAGDGRGRGGGGHRADDGGLAPAR